MIETRRIQEINLGGTWYPVPVVLAFLNLFSEQGYVDCDDRYDIIPRDLGQYDLVAGLHNADVIKCYEDEIYYEGVNFDAFKAALISSPVPLHSYITL